jgi:hypothetical protein
MAYLIDRIRSQLATSGIKPGTREARQWLLSKSKNLNASKSSLMNDMARLRENAMIGRMYFFFYDAKHKNKLPYFDRFPLVLPIEVYPDSFLGLNLHYIYPKHRLILLDKLSEFANNKNYDKTTKLRLSYDLLKRTSKVYETNACLKKYLFSNIQSRFLEISADEWDIAALLPTENFSGSSTSRVHSNSRMKY